MGGGYIWSYWNNTVYSFIVEFLRFIPVLTVGFCILLMHSSRMAEDDPYLAGHDQVSSSIISLIIFITTLTIRKTLKVVKLSFVFLVHLHKVLEDMPCKTAVSLLSHYWSMKVIHATGQTIAVS